MADRPRRPREGLHPPAAQFVFDVALPVDPLDRLGQISGVPRHARIDPDELVLGVDLLEPLEGALAQPLRSLSGPGLAPSEVVLLDQGAVLARLLGLLLQPRQQVVLKRERAESEDDGSALGNAGDESDLI